MTNRYHLLPAEGKSLESTQDINDFLSEAFSARTDWIAVPVVRLDPTFFDLSTRLLGETAQKFQNYGIGFAVLGDVSEQVAQSSALRDFVRETNRGKAFWFVTDEVELNTRLDGQA